MCRCDKLLILGYRYAQEVDSKVRQMIYVLQRVVLMEFMQNEQISTRNTWELHENSKNKHFKVALLTDWSKWRNSEKLTDSQPLDI